MSNKFRNGLSWFVSLFLIAVGIWQIYTGEPDFGAGLIGGIVAVNAVRFMKQKRMKELQAQGMNPYDERTYAISYRASYSTLVIMILLSAAFVLIGSISGPEITVNPYNFTGGWMALMIVVYLIIYYTYNRKM